MSSDAAKRAAARRKAILSSKSDRLAKLTSSARGDDAGNVFKADEPTKVPSDPPLSESSQNFVGETIDLPKPIPRVPYDPPPILHHPTPPSVDPTIWNEQQEQFMRALLNGHALSASEQAPSASNSSDPLAALLASLASGQPPLPSTPGISPSGAGVQPQAIFNGQPIFNPNPFSPEQSRPTPPSPPEKTLFTKLIPLLHFVSTVLFLVFFVFWYEPAARGISAEEDGASRWQRWAELSRRKPSKDDPWTVKPLPMLWGFVTLQLILHSWRIFAQTDPPPPPALLQLVLPYLPPPLPAILINALKYFQMIGMIFDDISVLLVGLWIVIWCSSWVA